MTQYVSRRLVQSVGVLLGVSIVVFFLIRLIPGDPAMVMLPEGASREQYTALRQEMGLDQPIPVQYLVFLGRALRGDLGKSLYFNKPVVGLLSQALPNTALLTIAAMSVALLVAIPMGIISAIKRDSLWDFFAMGLAMVGQSMPAFWLGLMLILIFAVTLHWLPTSGMRDWRSLVLPTVTLGFYIASLTTRLVRSGMLDILADDFIRTARGKGLPEWRVLIRHALPNLLIPVVTIVGLQLGALLGGAVITETVFAWPGVGTVLYRAITVRDYPLVQATVLMMSAIFVVVNLGVDLLYAAIDPRIRFSRN